MLASCGSDPEVAKDHVPTPKHSPPSEIVSETTVKKDLSTTEEIIAEKAQEVAPKEKAKIKAPEAVKPKPKAKPTKVIDKPKKPRPEAAPQPEKRPMMTFDATLFNYGKIAQGDIVMHEFEFTNTGNAELVVTDVRASCGCTQPTYPFLPIMPGEKGLIGVKFDSKGKLGKMKPIVTITTNAEPAVTRLFLEGFVGDTVKDEKASTPANDSTLLH